MTQTLHLTATLGLARPMQRVTLFAALIALVIVAPHPVLAIRTEHNATPPMDRAEYDRLIAPYVAKARATYPTAKKRFLDGLPPRYTFAVWMRLYQKQEGKVVAFEDCFLSVERIVGGRIYGRLENKPQAVAGYSMGDHVVGPESEIRNWMIEHPNGFEEGNVVGKFLERHVKIR